jgi:hypothetical protein
MENNKQETLEEAANRILSKEGVKLHPSGLETYLKGNVINAMVEIAKEQAGNRDTTIMGGDNIPDTNRMGWSTGTSRTHPTWTSTTTWDKLDTTNSRTMGNNNTVNMSALRETITKYLDDIDSYGDDKDLRESIDVLHDFVLYIDATDENGEVNVAKWGDFIIQ